MQRNTAQHATRAHLEIGFLMAEDSKTWVSVDVQQDRLNKGIWIDWVSRDLYFIYTPEN